MQRFLTTDQVLGILGIHIQTLSNWVKSGKMPKPYKILGRNLFSEAHILDWIRNERDTIAAIYARYLKVKEEEATLSQVDFGFLSGDQPPVMAKNETSQPATLVPDYHGEEDEEVE